MRVPARAAAAHARMCLSVVWIKLAASERAARERELDALVAMVEGTPDVGRSPTEPSESERRSEQRVTSSANQRHDKVSAAAESSGAEGAVAAPPADPSDAVHSSAPRTQSESEETSRDDLAHLTPQERSMVAHLAADEVLGGGIHEWIARENATDTTPLPESISMNALPDAVLTHLFSFLDPIPLARCMRTGKRWNRLAGHERLWRRQCKIALRVQGDAEVVEETKREARLRRSWRLAFANIPQVRYSGMYVLRMSYFRKPYVDLWHQPPPFLVCVYFRILQFRRDGSLLYANAPGSLQDVVSAMRQPARSRPSTVRVGRFRLQRDVVHAEIPLEHGVVQRWTFRLREGKVGWSEAGGLPAGGLEVLSMRLCDLPVRGPVLAAQFREEGRGADSAEVGDPGDEGDEREGASRRGWGWFDEDMTPVHEWEAEGTLQSTMTGESLDFVRLRL